MKAPRCRVCQKEHYGRCSEWTDRIQPEVPPLAESRTYESAVEPGVTPGMVEVITKLAAAIVPKGAYAPTGQCPWCDHRRRKQAQHQSAYRKRQLP